MILMEQEDLTNIVLEMNKLDKCMTDIADGMIIKFHNDACEIHDPLPFFSANFYLNHVHEYFFVTV